MTGRELLLGSSFSVGGGGKDGAPSWGAWGRFATGGFETDADGMRVEGDVTTGLLGADASRGRWLAGVAVSLSRGEGPFRLTSAMESNRLSGTVESSLTALYPYAKLGLSDRMEAWGMVGLGTGELTVREGGGRPIETDLGMTMGAVGARGRLLSAGAGGGLDLALRSDAMWVRMKSDAVSGGEGNLAAAQALVSRLRLIVEGSRTFAMADERTITPRGEVGVRHDLGDAETGTGLEVGAGVKFAGNRYTVNTGLTNDTAYTFEVQARNAEGDSGPSNQASATPAASDTTAPMLRSATTTALELKLFHDEVLDADSEPAPSAFTVTVNGASRAVTGVSLGDTKVRLTLASAVRAGDTVTVTYTVPAMNPLRDEARNPAAAFSDHPVTNETPATAPDAPSSLEATPGDGSVTLRWTASAYDGGRAVTSHQYRRKTTGAFEAWQDIPESAPGGANAASYPVTRLTNGTAYTFEVRAWNVEGESGPSNEASATPATVPSAPRSFTATAGNGEVRLQWLAPASTGGSAILRYQYRQRYGSQAYGNWTNIADSAPGAANANSYTVTGLLGNAQYRFEVRAVNTGGPGAESNEVVETPVPVKKLRASQKAWMARFDRTVATQVVDAIGDRFSGGGARGVTVGGQSLNRTGGAVDDALARDRLLGELGAEPKVLSMDGRELLLGSSFSVGGGGKDGAPSWGAWGRFATGGFEADADGMRVEGDVTTGLLGADASRGRWLAGVAVSLSRGEGPFRLTSAMESNRLSGTVESSLTALYPYAKLGLSDRMEAWGLVGLGTGELTVRESGGTPIETDLGMTMGAVGTRGRLLSADEGGGLDLALRSDAMWVRMKSDAVSGGEGNLAAAQALVSRLRLIVEGSRTFAMADERTITPRGEIGVRHDLGDAETGTGLEVGAGVKFAGDGFSIEGAVRALVAHEDAHYREWGASGAIRVDPGAAGRGLSLSIVPTWGNAASAAARLWSARDAGGLVRADDFEAKGRLEAELGYGVGAPHGPGLVTPYAGLTLSGDAHRALRTGVRWNASQSAAVSLEASREGQGSGEAPANALTLRAEAHW